MVWFDHFLFSRSQKKTTPQNKVPKRPKIVRKRPQDQIIFGLIGFASLGFRKEGNMVGLEHPGYPGRIKLLHMRREIGKKSPSHHDLPRVLQLRVLLLSSADAEQRPRPRRGRALVESWMGGGRGWCVVVCRGCCCCCC